MHLSSRVRRVLFAAMMFAFMAIGPGILAPQTEAASLPPQSSDSAIIAPADTAPNPFANVKAGVNDELVPVGTLVVVEQINPGANRAWYWGVVQNVPIMTKSGSQTVFYNFTGCSQAIAFMLSEGAKREASGIHNIWPSNMMCPH